MVCPDNLFRLDSSRRSSNPYLNCLLETEDRLRSGDYSNVSEGDMLWYLTYGAEYLKLVKGDEVARQTFFLEVEGDTIKIQYLGN